MGFYMPVRVADEEGAVARHAKELAGLGRKALIVTGRHAAFSCGAYDDVRIALQGEGCGHCLFSDIEENPSVETVVRASAFGAAEEADFVIGIGGGSAMDAAKAIAFLLAREKSGGKEPEETPEAALYDAALSPDHLPVAAVPTTCGTGSEVTGVSVLTLHTERTKKSIPHKIFPALALIDARYLAGAPRKLIVNTAMDALAHMLESCGTKAADDYSRAQAMAGLALWGREKEVLLGEREMEAGDLRTLLRASTFAGMAIAQTGTSIPHALSYILTYEEKLSHGAAAGYFLPAFMKEAEREDRDALLRTAGFADVEEFERFCGQCIGRPEVSEATLLRAFEAVAANRGRLASCRIPMDEKVLRRIAGI